MPGLQQDADTESGPLSGRLKIRVGGNTVTYRGALSVTERDPDHFAVAGEGTEVRGSGTVKLALALRLTPEGDHRTRLDFTAGATADGRAAGFTAGATATAVQRLLERAAEQLAEAARGEAAGPEVNDPVADAEEAEGDGSAGSDDDATEVTASVFEAEVPPPSLDPFLAGGFEELDDLGDLPRPPAEAAHARRTMIGRSAEEVDHAPPRGRYAPSPRPPPPRPATTCAGSPPPPPSPWPRRSSSAAPCAAAAEPSPITLDRMSTQLSAGGAELTIDQENGCRISSLRVDGIELLRQGPHFGAFPMVPWCGRTAEGRFRDGGVVHQLPLNHPPHAIHGLGRDTAWRRGGSRTPRRRSSSTSPTRGRGPAGSRRPSS